MQVLEDDLKIDVRDDVPTIVTYHAQRDPVSIGA